MLYSRIGDIEDNKSGYHSTWIRVLREFQIQSTLYTIELSSGPSSRSWIDIELNKIDRPRNWEEISFEINWQTSWLRNGTDLITWRRFVWVKLTDLVLDNLPITENIDRPRDWELGQTSSLWRRFEIHGQTSWLSIGTDLITWRRSRLRYIDRPRVWERSRLRYIDRPHHWEEDLVRRIWLATFWGLGFWTCWWIEGSWRMRTLLHGPWRYARLNRGPFVTRSLDAIRGSPTLFGDAFQGEMQRSSWWMLAPSWASSRQSTTGS